MGRPGMADPRIEKWRRRFEQGITLNDVHDAIDLMGRLFQKYGNLLTAASWVDLTPVLQHDWEAVFRVPWIQDARGR
jgi:hypothetical protein